MAIKKTLTGAIPSVLDSKVVVWNLTMKYEEGTEGEADYYTNDIPYATSSLYAGDSVT